MFEYEIAKQGRQCSVTGRELGAGETVYSALFSESGSLIRRDYCQEAWNDSPPHAIASWKSKIEKQVGKPKPAPSEAILEAFLALEDSYDRADLRYLLGLLLIRRRVFRHEGIERSPSGREELVVFCAKTEHVYRIATVNPDPNRMKQMESEIGQILGIAPHG